MKNQELIAQMTLEEKCGLLSGRDIWSTKAIERLGISPIYLSDGPSGLRKQLGDADHLGLNASQPATCLPSSACIANGWDPDLAESAGSLVGREAVAQGVEVVLGPGLNVKRSPLCGRNFEYYSEDPYLAGKLAAGFIRGIEKQGVAACPKHFAVNSQEWMRMASDSVVDERTLREIYLTNFEIAVREGNPRTIMTAYNRVNGVYANENEHLLKDILVGEWGFTGAVVTDWGGSNDHVAGVAAGSHLEMPATGGDSDRQLAKAVREGRIAEALVDQRVDELLTLILSAKGQGGEPSAFDAKEHHLTAQKIAEQTVVLLKNEAGLLPLSKGTKVAVIGDFAAVPRYQGAGSSVVNPTQLDSLLGVLEQFPLESVGYCQGFRRNGQQDAALLEQALELAKRAEVVLVCLGLPEINEVEGMDREHMRLPDNQIQLLAALRAVQPELVVTLSAGSAVEMPWLSDCKALVYGCLGGQAGAGALLKVMMGETNPSGKLAETFPLLYTDLPVSRYFHNRGGVAEYREGPYIGYRYFETAQKPVCFPFGFGLSYTTFAYTDLCAEESEIAFTLENTGKVAGAEIAQVYIGCPEGKVFRPAKELKGFQKVVLAPGEKKRVTIALDDKAFRYYDVETQAWQIESGEYRIMVGASAQDIRLTETLRITGTAHDIKSMADQMPSYYSADVFAVSRAEFEALAGHEAPEAEAKPKGLLGINDAICQMDNAKSALARWVHRILTWLKDRSLKKGKPDLNILFIYNMPFRGIAKMMGGMVTMEMAEALVVMVNGHVAKGLKAFISGYFSNRRLIKTEQSKKGAEQWVSE